MITSVLSESLAVYNRLHELGLTEEILRQAVEAGERARLACTPNHPRITPGIMAWSETIRVLRDRLMPMGWTKRDDGGVPTVVHPNSQIAIAAMTGDEGTGEIGELRSKYSKGPATAALVENNSVQLEFDQSIMGFGKNLTNRQSAITWYLVTRRHNSELRFELSLPLGIGENGHIEDWKERIILPAIELDPTVHLDAEAADEGSDIIVEVTPRF